MSGRGQIFQTPRSSIYQFRSWISDERKYYSKTLNTTDKVIALQLAEEEVLKIKSVILELKLGLKIFSSKFIFDISKKKLKARNINRITLIRKKTKGVNDG